jgi:hypothetical protein
MAHANHHKHDQPEDRASYIRFAGGVSAVIGAIYFGAPFFFGFVDVSTALWNHMIAGVLLMLLAGLAVRHPLRRGTMGWLAAALGVWIIVSPFVLGHAWVYGSVWPSVILGVYTVLMGVFAASEALGIE